jgi:hypothetical protein
MSESLRDAVLRSPCHETFQLAAVDRLALSVIAFLTYFSFFARFPATRDIP